MSLKHLTSKLLAGGLTAGIVLIWWPRHYPTDGLEWLVLRGIVATLGFELMLLAYTPIEDRIAARLARRRSVGRLRERVGSVPAPARAGGSMVFAVAALALPLMLLATAGAPPVEREPEPVTRVVREIVVKKQVVHDEVPVPAAPGGPAPDRVVTAPGAGAADRGASGDRASTGARDSGGGDAGRSTGDRDAQAGGGESQAPTESAAPTRTTGMPTTTASTEPAPPVDGGAATSGGDPAATGAGDR